MCRPQANRLKKSRPNKKRAPARINAVKRAAPKQTKTSTVTLNDLYTKFKEGTVKELNLLVKADVAGSLEPIVSSLEKLGDGNLHAKIVRQGIGTVTQADVMLAAASQGIVIAFNVGIEGPAETLADQEKVDIRKYNIIYKLIEDIDKALKGMLEPEYKDVLTGRAQVLKIFNVKKNVVAGSRVIKGTVARGTTAKVMRGQKEIFTRQFEFAQTLYRRCQRSCRRIRMRYLVWKALMIWKKTTLSSFTKKNGSVER